jgi:BirA family biotin operon repressor/biotin-[acetyl-CoA-carboxylase] ligase
MFHIFDSLPSTNDYCLDYAKNHPNSRIVCIAHHQTQGRGRNGKIWDSEDSRNLYLS